MVDVVETSAGMCLGVCDDHGGVDHVDTGDIVEMWRAMLPQVMACDGATICEA